MWELSEDIMGQELLEATEELEKKKYQRSSR
jgi:hypothetical protein